MASDNPVINFEEERPSGNSSDSEVQQAMKKKSRNKRVTRDRKKKRDDRERELEGLVITAVVPSMEVKACMEFKMEVRDDQSSSKMGEDVSVQNYFHCWAKTHADKDSDGNFLFNSKLKDGDAATRVYTFKDVFFMHAWLVACKLEGVKFAFPKTSTRELPPTNIRFVSGTTVLERVRTEGGVAYAKELVACTDLFFVCTELCYGNDPKQSLTFAAGDLMKFCWNQLAYGGVKIWPPVSAQHVTLFKDVRYNVFGDLMLPKKLAKFPGASHSENCSSNGDTASCPICQAECHARAGDVDQLMKSSGKWKGLKKKLEKTPAAETVVAKTVCGASCSGVFVCKPDGESKKWKFCTLAGETPPTPSGQYLMWEAFLPGVARNLNFQQECRILTGYRGKGATSIFEVQTYNKEGSIALSSRRCMPFKLDTKAPKAKWAVVKEGYVRMKQNCPLTHLLRNPHNLMFRFDLLSMGEEKEWVLNEVELFPCFTHCQDWERESRFVMKMANMTFKFVEDNYQKWPH